MAGCETDENRKIDEGISLELRAAYGQRRHACIQSCYVLFLKFFCHFFILFAVLNLRWSIVVR